MQIELLKPHTHAGVHHAAGDRFSLDDAQALWLISLGVAHAASSTPFEKAEKTEKLPARPPLKEQNTP